MARFFYEAFEVIRRRRRGGGRGRIVAIASILGITIDFLFALLGGATVLLTGTGNPAVTVTNSSTETSQYLTILRPPSPNAEESG